MLSLFRFSQINRLEQKSFKWEFFTQFHATMSFIGKTLGKIVGHPAKSSSNPQSTQQPAQQSSSQLAQNNNQANLDNFSSNNAPSSSNFTRSHHHHLSHDAQLTLTHLRKVFYEYLHPKHHDLSLTEKDEKLYSILPLFIKVRRFFFAFF